MQRLLRDGSAQRYFRRIRYLHAPAVGAANDYGLEAEFQPSGICCIAWPALGRPAELPHQVVRDLEGGIRIVRIDLGAVFLFAGVIKGQLKFSSDNLSHHILGAALVAFALVIYPILAELLGHGYPAMPTFGLPCPTTIFTIGVLCFLTTPFPRYILVAPILWSAVGSQAAFLLGVYQDLGLLVAGIVAAYLVVVAPRVDATSK